ncbi:DUF6776 family protein [Thalassotalea piscium]|uniref:Uncharacterized protein n=1 Tax=Thalassotalea piscium TaxID=1230533 RepID=A0A7X0TV06_9GAMM|nr:DUF6776 family protein [Thalassotalea piscium]MBB6544635.1 hypothetical protein [Thalassotalea piscium]
MGNFFHGYQIQTINQQNIRLDNLYEQQVQQVKQIHTLEVELEVERMASMRSQQLLKEIEKEHFKVKKELAFYEKVMAPEKQVDGVVVDSITVMATESSNHFRFQVVLVQQQVRRRYAKGYIDLVFEGSLDNNPDKISLDTVSNITKKMLSFSFQYFQIIEGEFTLPEGFTPEKVNLVTSLNKTSWQDFRRVEQSYVWLDIIKK